MIWTRASTQLHATPAAAGKPIIAIIARNANTAIVSLFGIESVPSNAAFHDIHLVIENPDGFYPKEIDG